MTCSPGRSGPAARALPSQEAQRRTNAPRHAAKRPAAVASPAALLLLLLLLLPLLLPLLLLLLLLLPPLPLPLPLLLLLPPSQEAQRRMNAPRHAAKRPAAVA